MIIMRKYIVHYRRNEKYWGGVLKGKRTITAQSSAHALEWFKTAMPDTYGHVVCEVYTRAA